MMKGKIGTHKEMEGFPLLRFFSKNSDTSICNDERTPLYRLDACSFQLFCCFKIPEIYATTSNASPCSYDSYSTSNVVPIPGGRPEAAPDSSRRDFWNLTTRTNRVKYMACRETSDIPLPNLCITPRDLHTHTYMYIYTYTPLQHAAPIPKKVAESSIGSLLEGKHSPKHTGRL